MDSYLQGYEITGLVGLVPGLTADRRLLDSLAEMPRAFSGPWRRTTSRSRWCGELGGAAADDRGGALEGHNAEAISSSLVFLVRAE